MPASVHTTPDAGATPRLDDSVCFNTPANTEIYTLPLRHSLPIFHWGAGTTSPGTVVSAGGNNFQVNAPTHTYGEGARFSPTLHFTHSTESSEAVSGATITVNQAEVDALTAARATQTSSDRPSTTA